LNTHISFPSLNCSIVVYNVLGELAEDGSKDTGKIIDINKSLEESKKSVLLTNEYIKNPNAEALKLEEAKDQVKFPITKICYMVGCYIIMLTVTLLKGSNYKKSLIDVESCSLNYWLIYLIYLPIALGVTYKISRDIKNEYNYRLSIGYPYNKHDVVWSDRIFIKYPIYSFISGVMAGLLGIGGGLIIGPLLLELGLHPLVSTATSNFMVLFTSSSTSIQFIIFGMMNYDYGLASTICSSIGSFFGTLIIQRIVEKTKRVSLLVLVLGAVLGVSTLLIPSYTLYTTIEQLRDGKDIWVFNSPC